MSKFEIIWNWFVGIFLTLGNMFLLFVYIITKEYSPYQIAMAIVLLIFGIVKISEMIYYITNKEV